jgi:tetratricopeptide (TPR) repeat protein
MNFIKIKSLIVLVLSVFTLSVFSQDINQAGEKFNEANQAVKANKFELAVQKYEEAMGIASQLGEEGEMIVINCQSQLPSLYYKMGVADYKEKKVEEAIGEFEKAIEFGTLYNDPETVKNATETIPKLYYAQGNTFYKKEKYDEALARFEKAAEMAPDYSRAYWGMGLAYNKLDDTKNMKDAFVKAQELATADGDDKMLTKINKNAKKIFQGKGAKKLQAQQWESALMCLDASLSFDPDNADTYYYVALANNGMKKFDAAVDAAQKGIEISAEKGPEYQAKLYYELGNALKGKGQNAKACEAYTSAKHGSFAESANYEITTVLKCN